MSKGITRKQLAKNEIELLGIHQVKISELNDFGYRLHKFMTYQGRNVEVYYPYKNGWLILTTAFDETGEYTIPGSAIEHMVTDEELITVEVKPYYTR